MGARGRWWSLFGILVLAAVASALFMKPVLLAPVAGDDRLWYPELAALESWSIADDVGHVPQWWELRTHSGRVNVVSIIERRTAARMVVETSVSTGTPTYVVHGALKLLLAALALLTLPALLRTVRCRRPDGGLVRLSGLTVVLCTLVGGVLFALGSQPAFHEVNGRNGWVNYPTHTFGAIVSILGVTALVLWLTRLYADGRHRVPIVLVLVLLAVLTNLRYELVFPAAPLALIALVLVPVTSAERAAEGRRAKWVTGISFIGVFVTILVVLRVYLHQLCEAERCYLGVTPQLSSGIAGAFWQNVASSVPGVTAPRVAEFVESRGISTVGMYTPTPWSVVVGGCLAVALLAGWWSTSSAASPKPAPAVESLTGDGIARGSDESRLLALAAVLCLVGALGAASVMSLSVNAQGSSQLGLPYRHAVVTWAGIAWTLALGTVAVGRRSPRAGAASGVVLSLVLGVTAACLLPAHERSLAANRIDNHATTAAFAALVNGDLSDSANAQRCRLVPAIVEERVDAAEAFDAAFRRHWGQEFCQRWRSPADGCSALRWNRSSVRRTFWTAGSAAGAVIRSTAAASSAATCSVVPPSLKTCLSAGSSASKTCSICATS